MYFKYQSLHAIHTTHCTLHTCIYAHFCGMFEDFWGCDTASSNLGIG